MRVFVLTFILALFSSLPAWSVTGGPGFYVGIGTGVAGVDYSDGTNRFNIGGVLQNLSLGMHVERFVLSLEGDFLTFGGSLDDYVADGGFGLRFYITDALSLKYKMTMARFQRMSNYTNITTFSLWTGGSAGGTASYDLIVDGTFRLNLNAGAQRYDFGSFMTRQGDVTDNRDLDPHMSGLMFFGYIGLDWYL
jgi:hypothetical protein